MKEKILAALQTRFEGVDEKTLGRIATKLAKTTENEDAINDAVNGVTFAQVMENYGDARATEAQRTAVANYEKSHGLKDGKPVTLPGKESDENVPGGEDTPAWFKAFQERQAALEAELKGYKAERQGVTRKAKLTEMLQGTPDNVRKMYESNFASMTFESDDAFNAWAEGQKPVIEGLVNDYKAKGAAVHAPRGGKTERQPGEADPLVVARAEATAKANDNAPSVFLSKPGN